MRLIIGLIYRRLKTISKYMVLEIINQQKILTYFFLTVQFTNSVLSIFVLISFFYLEMVLPV